MGFWEQMNGMHAGDRRQKNNKYRTAGTMNKSEDDYSDAGPDSEESDLTLETLLSQWDMCDIESEHPEWFQDPEFIRGFVMMQIMDMNAFEQFANAASKGNILALVAIGDFWYRVFEFQTNGKRYRFGTEEFTDGLIKSAMLAYAFAMIHDPYFEKMQERLLIFKWNFAYEREFMNVLEEIGDKLNDFSFDHPEELRKLFSL